MAYIKTNEYDISSLFLPTAYSWVINMAYMSTTDYTPIVRFNEMTRAKFLTGYIFHMPLYIDIKGVDNVDWWLKSAAGNYYYSSDKHTDGSSNINKKFSIVRYSNSESGQFKHQILTNNKYRNDGTSGNYYFRFGFHQGEFDTEPVLCLFCKSVSTNNGSLNFILELRSGRLGSGFSAYTPQSYLTVISSLYDGNNPAQLNIPAANIEFVDTVVFPYTKEFQLKADLSILDRAENRNIRSQDLVTAYEFFSGTATKYDVFRYEWKGLFATRMDSVLGNRDVTGLKFVGTTAERPTWIVGTGFSYTDTDIEKNIVRVSKGTPPFSTSNLPKDGWFEEDGSEAGVLKGGTTALRPKTLVPDNFVYFDTTLGKPVFVKTKGYPNITTFTFTAGITAAGSFKITLDGVEYTIPVALADTMDIIISKMKTIIPGFIFASVSSSEFWIVARKYGSLGAYSFNGNGTGITGNFTVVHSGTNRVWVDATGATV